MAERSVEKEIQFFLEIQERILNGDIKDIDYSDSLSAGQAAATYANQLEEAEEIDEECVCTLHFIG